jgi:hypothetical protein
MKRFLPWLLIVWLLSGCRSLETIPYYPAQTPESWLSIQPFTEVQIGSRALILVQPSTSAIVYLLGILGIAAGIYFLRIQQGQRSRQWWGAALLLWGAGALLAGTSYEAFSYAIKCAGRTTCIWTSGWEIFYLVLSAASVDAMLAAQAYACTQGKTRRVLLLVAIVHIVLYSAAVLAGSLVPVKFLISFELLILVLAPDIVVFLALNGGRYYRLKQRMDLILLGIWGWLILTIAAYFIYYISGFSQALWGQGKWFTENDVLHIGLILWMIYIVRIAAPEITDQPELQA